MTSNLDSIFHKSLFGYYAGIVSRSLAFIIDVVIINFFFLFTTWLISVSLNVLQVKSFLRILTSTSSLANKLMNIIIHPAIAGILYFLFVVFYFILFWVLAGKTPGKALLGLRVVSESGHKISFTTALVRYFSYFLSCVIFGLGFLWILIDEKRQAWHDKLAHTYVVYSWDAHPDETFLAQETEDISSRHRAMLSLIKERKEVKKRQD